MRSPHPRILIAAPADVIRELGRALGEEVEVIAAETWDQALSRLDEIIPALILVCYAFDEMRPFRLVNYVRLEWQRASVPTILIRALPVHLGTTEEDQIRQSYKTVGVDEFINLYDTRHHQGTQAAYERLRDSVFSRLPAGGDESAPQPTPMDAGHSGSVG
jgi:PleD family two-component response regulator